ncbi:unnamed protein product [Lymnaea stagnalis]|uniref:GAR domain-containing protein n=1 Tax=Lymnaea stagnalis TaxID=6523 RepID=A0AAV2HWR7_LYMST
MLDETLFDSEDLVTHHKERQVIYCLMELARLGARFGIEPPSLISMEVDLECESTLSNEEASMSTPPLPFSEPSACVDETLTTDTNMISALQVTDVTISTKTSAPSLDSEIARVSAQLKKQDHVTKLSEGVYNVFGKHVFIRLLKGKHLMVRVGGGWDTFEHYLLHHDPIHIYEYHKGSHSIHSPREVKDTESLEPDPKKFLVVKSRYS